MKSASEMLVYIDRTIALAVSGEHPIVPQALERYLKFLDQMREYMLSDDDTAYRTPGYLSFLSARGVPMAQLYCSRYYLGRPAFEPGEIELLKELRQLWKEYLAESGRAVR